MATHLKMSIDIMKIPNSFVTDIKGNKGTKKCLCIPLEETRSLYIGKKGAYLKLMAVETPNSQFGDSHFIKVDDYDKVENPTPETIFIGSIKDNKGFATPEKPRDSPIPPDELKEVPTDLPF